jgi:hypothetical protein
MSLSALKVKSIGDWDLYRCTNAKFAYNNNKKCDVGAFKWIGLTAAALPAPLASADPSGPSLCSEAFTRFADDASNQSPVDIQGASFITADHLTFGNMFHAIFDHFYRAWLLLSNGVEISNLIFLSSTWDWAKFVIASVVPSHVKTYFVEPAKVYLLNESLFFSNTFGFAVQFRGKSTPWNSHRLKPYDTAFTAYLHRRVTEFTTKVQPAPDAKQLCGRLFVSRLPTKQRGFVNQQEVELAFAREGFEIVYLEQLDPLQQLLAFRERSHIAGFHGAGLTNLIAADSATKVLEMFSTVTNNCYERISEARGLPYKAIHTCSGPQTTLCDLQLLSSEIKQFTKKD